MTETAQTQDAEASAEPGWEWAVLEVFGHRKHVGRIREEERFGTKMLRIDIPIDGDPAQNGWRSHYYSGGSIFSLSLTDEESVMKANAPYRPASRLTYSAPAESDECAEDERGQDPDWEEGDDDRPF